MSDRYNLPVDTAILVNDRIARCKNLALILDKYPPQHVVADTKNKGPWLQGLIKGDHIDAPLAQSAYNRWRSMMSAIEATCFDVSLDWRIVIGLGGESVLETDITLHHLYGIPFIPGSALKGLTRAYVTGEIEGYKSDKEEKDNEEIKRIFGSQDHAGTVIFFDAMPTNGKAAFALDIMNPHYGDYYGGSKPPTNDQNPLPITYLTVTGTTFTFALLPRRAASKEQEAQHIKDVEQVKDWLQEALRQYGIGGKTSAGYGYFREPDSLVISPSPSSSSVSSALDHDNDSTGDKKNGSLQSPDIDPEVKKAQGYKQEVEALKDVAGSIHSYYQRWQQLTSEEARKLLAQAIIEKVRKAGREKASAEKTWYKELQAFLGNG